MSSTLTSVDDLNKRAWFRLLKVFYVSAFIVIAVFLLLAAQQSAYVEDQSSITAAQLFASGTEVTPPAHSGRTVDVFDPSLGIEMVSPNHWIPIPFSQLGIPDVPQPPAPTYHENWLDFSIIAIVALLIEAALFWLIRRVFYYVVIGTPVWTRRRRKNGESKTS